MRTYRAVVPTARPCAHCGEEFVAKRRDARFCSVACRVAVHRGAAELEPAELEPEILGDQVAADDDEPDRPSRWENPVDGPFWDTVPERFWPREIRYIRLAAEHGVSVEEIREELEMSTKDNSPEGNRKYLEQLAKAGIYPDELRRKVEATHARVEEILERARRYS